MKNFIPLLVSLFLFPLSLSAQYLIEGSIFGDDGSRLETATITLHHLADSSFDLKTTTNENGYFVFSEIEKGQYYLEVEKSDFEIQTIKNLSFPKDKDKVVAVNLKQDNNGLILNSPELMKMALASYVQPLTVAQNLLAPLCLYEESTQSISRIMTSLK
jgi:hypothetical protein